MPSACLTTTTRGRRTIEKKNDSWTHGGRLEGSATAPTTANTAPFIGLFGTVWGIMSSFHSIGMLKSASLATVAPGISEALIATAIGLAVAVPATIGYNIFLGKLFGNVLAEECI